MIRILKSYGLWKSEHLPGCFLFRKTIVLFLVLGMAMVGCTSTQELFGKPSAVIEPGVTMVVPFKNMYRIYGEGVSYGCPWCGTVQMTGEVAEGADDFMTDLLVSRLIERSNMEVVPPGRYVAVSSGILTQPGKEPSEKDLVMRTGKSLGADTALLCSLFRFKQRVGTGYSVESPASVGFSIILVRIPDGKILWTGHFDETQKALNENLFEIGTFFKRKAKWLKAEELATYAMDDLLATFPGGS